MRELAGKRVLITGSGSGLGRELALAFAEAGAEIVATDINVAGIVETAKLVQAAGGRAISISMDVTNVDSVLAARRQLHQLHGPIDILVNNAGILRGGRFLDVPMQGHRDTFAVNTLGPVIVTHAFLPDLIAQPEGYCVNIVSAAGMIPLPNAATYAASKWAALGFSESIREELRIEGHRHVRVTAVCPGLIDTELFAQSRPPRLMPRLKTAPLAKQIVRAVTTGKHYLRTPWLVRIIPICKAVLPLSVGRRIVDWLGVTTMLRSVGQPPTPRSPGLAPSFTLDPLHSESAADAKSSQST
jgi:NAD(P)-dependent dehydrogenase (short-subunit alcohol dehydrogenase family)